MHRMQPAAVAAALALSSSHAFAGIVSTFSVGAGASTSTIQVDFSNGNGYVVNLSWTEPMSGFQAMQAIAAGIAGAQLQYDVFPFGSFVTGIGLGADFEYGNGDLWPIENYWHYWTEVNGQWELAMFGAGDRALADGSADAWVFGSSAAPQAVPAPGAVAHVAVACVWHRFRRRRPASG
jgi:hypothetical protein